MAEDSVYAIDSLEEIERSKRALAPYLDNAMQLDPVYSTNFRLNKLHQTTVSPCSNSLTRTSASQASKPELPQLSETRHTKALGFELAQALQRNEKLMNDITEILIRNIHSHNEAILKLSKEDESRLNDLLDQLSKKENVSTVKSLLNVVTSATAITIGAILLAPETAAALTATAAGSALYASVSSVWSYLLIATGISNIVTNEILPRIGGYEKMASFFTSTDEEKQNLAENIHITTSLTTTVMGVVSSIATSPLLGAVLDWSHGLKLLNTTLELSNGAANFTYDVNEQAYNKLQAQQTLVDGEKRSEQSLLDRTYMQLHSAQDIQQAFNKISFSIFETLRKMQQENTQ